MSLALTPCRYACCSARNALVRLLTSSTTFSVETLTVVQSDKHLRSYVSISTIDALDALWMFSMAVSRAMSTCWRRESQCSRIANSDSMDILVSSAVDSLIRVRCDLSFRIELKKMIHNQTIAIDDDCRIHFFSQCIFKYSCSAGDSDIGGSAVFRLEVA